MNEVCIRPPKDRHLERSDGALDMNEYNNKKLAELGILPLYCIPTVSGLVGDQCW